MVGLCSVVCILLVFYVLLRVLDDLVDGCLRLEVLYDLMAIFARYVRCTMVTLVKRAGTCSLVLASSD